MFMYAQDEQRKVSKEEGKALARQHGCLFIETSAKNNVKISQAFEELVRKILETPQLVQDSSSVGTGLNLRASGQKNDSSCSCII